MSEDRKRRWLVWTPVLLAVLLIISVSGIFIWSPLNCWHEDMDIRSGRIRYTRYVLFCCISERIASTPLSEALQPSNSPAGGSEWHRVNTFSPGVHHSPHYAFHGAIAQTQMLAGIWSTSAFTPAARHESAMGLLTAWQRGRNYHAAQRYLDALMVLASARSKQDPTHPIDVRDLPSNEPGNA